MTERVRHDIQDDYPEYLDDEMGYAWDSNDILTLEALRRHDAILHASRDELEEIDPAGLDDFDRWGLARALRERGEDGFLDVVRLIISSEASHPGLAYDEIFLVAIETMAEAQLFDEAQLHLTTFRERWPDRPEAARLGAMVAFRQDVDAGRKQVENLAAVFPDDADLRFEIAEDLLAMGREEEAINWLSKAEKTAQRTGNRPLLVDIELFRKRLESGSAES